METTFFIVVPRAGQEAKYLYHSVPKESNGQLVFEMQFDFFVFRILSQQVGLPSFRVWGNTVKENRDCKKVSGITVGNNVIMQFSDIS